MTTWKKYETRNKEIVELLLQHNSISSIAKLLKINKSTVYYHYELLRDQNFINRSVPMDYFKCKKCEKNSGKRSSFCSQHRGKRSVIDYTTLKISDVRVKAKYQVSARIRQLARVSYAKSGKQKCCLNCGYSIKIDICHINAISSFPESTTISTVNDPDNLVALCKRCHWEFDNGIINITNCLLDRTRTCI